jgi:prepilin-type N-terminal cleavage/methylation domain-containing protein
MTIRPCTKNQPGFSLLEMLVAMGVLTIMLVFMFSVVDQSIRAWESGSRQMEAAQAARVGLDLMARNLQSAIAASNNVFNLAGSGSNANVAPVILTNNAKSIPGEKSQFFKPPPQSGQIFAIAPLAPVSATNSPFSEIGFFPVYSADPNGRSIMAGRRYALIWHSPATTNNEPVTEIFYRGTPNNDWLTTTNDSLDGSGNRMILVDNCYQMRLRFASNSPTGLAFVDQWPRRDSLPAGVVVSLKVMDRKTAARIAQLRPDGLTADDFNPGPNNFVERVLRAGTVEVSRFIPFLNSTN